MPSLPVTIVEYTTLVESSGPYMKLRCRTELIPNEFTLRIDTPDLMSILGQAALSMIDASPAPTTTQDAAILFQTAVSTQIFAKLIEKGYLSN